MLHASSPEQQVKRRRVESSRNNNIAPGPSSEVLPLVLPSLVKKSSKDPNRGMYPRKRENSRNKFALSLPTFRKASKLYRESTCTRSKDLKSETTDTSLSDISVQDDVFQSKKSQSFDKHGKATSSISQKSHFLPSKSKGPKSLKSKSTVTITNKILNYFKPTPQSNTKRKKVDNSKRETSNADVPSTSGFKSSSNHIELSKENTENFFKKYQNCYGLLGACDEQLDEQFNYFERLPAHVIETILCQIPFLDMMKCRLVCSAWNEIIGDNKFMEWKKVYYGVKLGKPDVISFMRNLCKSMSLSIVEDCFKVLIRFMADKYRRKPSKDMSDLLMKNPKAIDAELVITERFPDIVEGKESKAWCIFAVAMLLSETVWDVYSVYKCLFYSKSACSLHDVTDAMYCVATFLMYFRDVFNINHGLHYRVYYSLYLIENNLPCESKGVQSLKIVKGLPGQQSIHSYSETSNTYLTYEQIRILNHCFDPKQVVKIIALAGTGKTTTLIHLARLYPQIKFLNVMFNKAVCEDAKKRFPTNVTCRTAHALAFKVFGRQLQHKLVSKIRPHDLMTFLKYNKGSHLHAYSYAKHVLDTIASFAASAAKEITKSHVPFVKDIDGNIISESDREKLKKDAIQIWNMMIDRNDKLLKITHDVYLKLYQLSKPKLSEYNCLMVDEAQDCNPAMLDIIISQNLPVILVGDPNQQIYGFRGANNALQTVEATHVYHLTKSFRFGPEIAYIASCCLEALKLNCRETLVGNTKPSFINGIVEGQLAVIARTNVQLFNEAVRMCCLNRFRGSEPTTIHGAFAGGIKGYGFEQLLDIYRLAENGRNRSGSSDHIMDKFVSKFKTFSDLCAYAKNVEDADLLSKIELVNQHSSSIPEYIKVIKEKCSHPMELANVIFSTAHKAKGLEFDTVFLTDDYQIGRLPHDMKDSVWCEETSVLYVALTRAKRCLLLPEKLIKILHLAQEKFEYPISSAKLLADKPDLRCIVCTENFVPHTTLILVRRKIVTASGRIINGGPLCVKCGSEPTFRPQVHIESVIMYLDPTNDYAHRSMASLVGPLPSDPPIIRNSFAAFNEMEVVYVINVNL